MIFCPSRPTSSNLRSRPGAQRCFGSFSRTTGSGRAGAQSRMALPVAAAHAFTCGWQAGDYVFGESTQ